ncbi:MAG: tRNA (N(6)-L-threonylcarbamoyladenosine(37)-C(2))-methylthiotransferase MtaB [Verrucomicrobiae bacterium]|nr:tRNA (N(6)-L-threonylcarbamoyladenosine(37)-C(2))-methylthiotransferase MtaB [Verrucomicrobiae bacterium]
MVSLNHSRKRAAVHTLGCRLNQSESLLLKDQLDAAGYTLTTFDEPCDLAIVNTCTVTRLADAKCRNAIRSFIRRNPKAFVAVVGCYSQIGYKEIAAIPGVDLIMGNQEKLKVLDYVKLGKNEKPLIIRDRITHEDFTIDFVGDRPYEKRANLKIQDGCSFVCSFCIIPKARGPARSRDMRNLLAEARQMAERGIREIVLTGVNIGTFQSREGDLIEVLDRLNAIDGIDRIRISSIEPTTIPTELFPRMNDPEHALLPFLHIPLQAGSDKVLESMRRKYTLKEYLDFLYLAHESVEDLCLGTDIMVGYPNEGEAEFEETCQTFLDAPFAYCHVFTFSERDGTPAARMANRVEVPVKQIRSAKLRRLSESRRYDYYEAHVGREMTVLFEDPRDGLWPGYTDNFVRVVVESRQDLHNQIGRVRLDRVVGEVVEGTLVELLPDQVSANLIEAGRAR